MLNFRLLIIAFNDEDFGNGRLQEHYCRIAKTTLICERDLIHKLATLNCEFTKKYVCLGVLRHYLAKNDTNLQIATFNVRMYNKLLRSVQTAFFLRSFFPPPATFAFVLLR